MIALLPGDKRETEMIDSSTGRPTNATRHLLGTIPGLGQRYATGPSLFVSCWIHCFRPCFELLKT